MENKLKKLFDYQKFENNSGLQRLIDDVHGKYGIKNDMRELSMDELDILAAAGVPHEEKEKKR